MHNELRFHNNWQISEVQIHSVKYRIVSVDRFFHPRPQTRLSGAIPQWLHSTVRADEGLEVANGTEQAIPHNVFGLAYTGVFFFFLMG